MNGQLMITKTPGMDHLMILGILVAMWSFSFDDNSDVLNWDEGQEGKGVIDNRGNVHTFDQEEYELHRDYMDQHEIHNAQYCFYITPKGEIESFDGTWDPSTAGFVEQIQEADPRLHAPGEKNYTPWRFN